MVPPCLPQFLRPLCGGKLPCRITAAPVSGSGMKPSVLPSAGPYSPPRSRSPSQPRGLSVRALTVFLPHLRFSALYHSVRHFARGGACAVRCLTAHSVPCRFPCKNWRRKLLTPMPMPGKLKRVQKSFYHRSVSARSGVFWQSRVRTGCRRCLSQRQSRF